jgi:hypothetical protein
MLLSGAVLLAGVVVVGALVDLCVRFADGARGASCTWSSVNACNEQQVRLLCLHNHCAERCSHHVRCCRSRHKQSCTRGQAQQHAEPVSVEVRECGNACVCRMQRANAAAPNGRDCNQQPAHTPCLHIVISVLSGRPRLLTLQLRRWAGASSDAAVGEHGDADAVVQRADVDAFQVSCCGQPQDVGSCCEQLRLRQLAADEPLKFGALCSNRHPRVGERGIQACQVVERFASGRHRQPLGWGHGAVGRGLRAQTHTNVALPRSARDAACYAGVRTAVEWSVCGSLLCHMPCCAERLITRLSHSQAHGEC